MQDDVLADMPNPFAEIEEYLTSSDAGDIICYIPFLRILNDGYITFQDFDKYRFDELDKINRLYALKRYIDAKVMQKNDG